MRGPAIIDAARFQEWLAANILEARGCNPTCPFCRHRIRQAFPTKVVISVTLPGVLVGPVSAVIE